MSPRAERPVDPPGGGRPDGRTRPAAERPVFLPGGGEPDTRRGADWSIAVLAGRQHGVVARRQLLAAGVSSRMIERRLAMGRLHRWRRGVYLVGHATPLPLATLMGAVLAAGPGAMLSHLAVGWLWGILQRSDRPIDVLVPGPRHPRPAGIRVHRVTSIPAGDRRERHGVPLTSSARTLVDLAALLPPDALARAVEEALVLRLVRRGELVGALAARRGARGVAVLAGILATQSPPSLTRSQAERRLLELVRAAGLPSPETNVGAAGFEVDMLWRVQRLVVEVDGYAFHGSRAAFERDRRKDAALLAAGLRVARLSWRQIVDEPQATAVLLARLLDLRPG